MLPMFHPLPLVPEIYVSPHHQEIMATADRQGTLHGANFDLMFDELKAWKATYYTTVVPRMVNKKNIFYL